MDTGCSPRMVHRDYRDATTARDSGVVHDAVETTPAASTSFTAVNHTATQPLTPHSSATAPTQQIPGRHRANGHVKRTRNPTVAQYLGLGSSQEPNHLEKYAPLSDIPKLSPAIIEPPRKRRRKFAQTEQPIHHITQISRQTEVPSQSLVTENYRAAKPRRIPCAKTPGSTVIAEPLATPPNSFSEKSNSPSRKAADPCQARPALLKLDPLSLAHDHLHSTTANTDSGLITSPDRDFHSDDTGNHEKVDAPPLCGDEDAFDDDDLEDDDLLALSPDVMEHCSSPQILTSPALGSNGEEANSGSIYCTQHSTADVQVQNDPISVSAIQLTKKFVSPVTKITHFLSTAGDQQSSEARQPIVRAPFPAAVRDRSPIIGLSPSSLLRTCFRIGEALNQAHQATKASMDIAFELYARVFESERDEVEQRFTLCDLFHTRMPHIKAVYSKSLWKSVPLFDYDSNRLSIPGRMCRCIGKMNREEKEWTLTVMNIWEATWDDIRWVEGIIPER